MTDFDLSPERSPADLVDALWRVRREQRKDLVSQVRGLARHPSPTVREEVVSLLAVKWQDHETRQLLLELLRADDDFGVRSRAAYALAAISSERTRAEDIRLLRRMILDQDEDRLVRAAAYEGLALVAGRTMSPLDDNVDVGRDLDLEWVRTLGE